MSKSKFTWSELVRREPRLKELERQIRVPIGDKNQEYFCANEVWYAEGGFKDQLQQLVGWEARVKDGIVNTSMAYAVAYNRLYKMLPNCRNCNCFPKYLLNEDY